MALHHFSGRYQLEQTACSPLSSLVRPSLSSGMDSMVGGRGRPVISHGMAKRGRKAYQLKRPVGRGRPAVDRPTPHVAVVTPFIISCRVMMLMMLMPTHKAVRTSGRAGGRTRPLSISGRIERRRVTTSRTSGDGRTSECRCPILFPLLLLRENELGKQRGSF